MASSGSGNASAHGIGQRCVQLQDLRLQLPSNRLECSSRRQSGPAQYLAINRRWRICFRWEEDGPYDVEVVDYH